MLPKFRIYRRYTQCNIKSWRCIKVSMVKLISNYLINLTSQLLFLYCITFNFWKNTPLSRIQRMRVMSYRRGRFINKFAHELHNFLISKLHVAKKLKMKWSLRASGSLSKRVCVSPSSTNARTLPRFIFSWECGASTSTFRIIGNQFRAKMAAIVEKVVRDAPDTRDKMSLQRHDLQLLPSATPGYCTFKFRSEFRYPCICV